MLAGGLPMAFPTVSIHESFAHPTSMFLRNLMAMDTEEMIRAQPMDAVVMIGGCDKTVPAQLMGAATPTSRRCSAGRPDAGRPLQGRGARRLHRLPPALGRAPRRRVRRGEIEAVNGRLAPTPGTCMVMGTAEHDGLHGRGAGHGAAAVGPDPRDPRRPHPLAPKPPGAAAVDAGRHGRPTPRAIMTHAAFRNAQVVLQAIGGSTNALIHLAAIAGRLRHQHRPGGVRRARPGGAGAGRPEAVGHHYMEHFHWAGGVPRLLRELGALIDLDAPDGHRRHAGRRVAGGRGRAGQP